MTSCIEQIALFQKKLNKYAKLGETDKVLYYIHKLNHLNVTVSHLEETGVGKTVNALRHNGGKVGEKARGLVNKWKAMVTAEDEEEEEEEAGEYEEVARARVEPPVQDRGEEEGNTEQQGSDTEEDREDNCLQIEENIQQEEEEEEEEEEEVEVEEDYGDRESELGFEEDLPDPIPKASHTTYGYTQGDTSGSDGEDGGNYNPLTSRRDYQTNTGGMVAEYHPSATSRVSRPPPKEPSSPEWDAASPSRSPDWKNGSNTKSPSKKSGKEEKDRSKDKHKTRGKGKHRDRSGSHDRDRDRGKRDHKEKHRDKHRDRDEDEERKGKSHRDKHRDKEKHHSKAKGSKHRVEEHSESAARHDRDSDGSIVNGFNTTPDQKERKRDTREGEKGTEERRRDRVLEGSGTSSTSVFREDRVTERTRAEGDREKENGRAKHRDNRVRKEKHKHEPDVERHKDEEESPGRQRKEKKNKSHVLELDGLSGALRDDSALKDRESRVGERTGKESEGRVRERDKHRDDKHKDHKASKKDKHKQDSSGKRSAEEREASVGEKTKKEKKVKHQSDADAGFGAALLGLDSPVKRKKKKKKKESEKERLSSEDEQPSTSGSSKRGLAGGAGLPDTKKPKLLSAPPDRLPKLPQVLPDEKPFLPEITPNYKPLPRLPVREEPVDSGIAKMTEEEALNLVFQSKNNRRSKVYSGKVYGLAYVPSLYDICIRVLQENIDALEFIGGIPFDILRPVLERANPKQLLNLEDYNPYLLEDSNVLWEVHCKRDFKNQKLEEMETWRELWLRCFDERELKLQKLTHNLQEKFRTKAQPKRTTKMAYVDTAAKVPKNVARAQAKYGTATASAMAAKPGKGNEVAARKTALQNLQKAERANPRPTAAAKKKKVAPLMAKTRQFFKKTFRR